METEDAWEIASRRASVISRRPSNHSIRIHPSSERAIEPQGGEPSTAVGLGPAAASVEELLAGPGSNEDSGSGTNSDGGDEGRTSGDSERLMRQTTVVPENRGVRDAGNYDMRNGSSRSSEDGVRADQGASNRIQGPSTLSIPLTNPVELAHPVSTDSNALALGETPRNDTFLASLAPGMHQRLDLAQRIDRLGVSVVHEEAEGDESWQDVGDESRGHVDDEQRSVVEPGVQPADSMYT